MKTRPLFSVWPADPLSYYINSVAASSDGERLIAGTFFKAYSADVGLDARRVEASPSAAADGSDPQAGTFGVYAYDRSGMLKWSDTFSGWQGIFWVDAASAAPVCAAGGWYSNTPSYQGVVRAYDVASGRRLLDGRTNSRVNQVSLSSDGTLLLAAADSLRLYRRSPDEFVPVGDAMLAEPGDCVVTAFLAGDGKTAVCAMLKRGIFVFSIAEKGLEQVAAWPWPVNTGCCHSVAVNPAGTAFVAGGSGGVYALFDVAELRKSGTPRRQYRAPNGAVVYSVAISDPGDELAACANVNGAGSKGLVLYHKDAAATPTWTYPTRNSPNRIILSSVHSLLAVADGYPDGCPGTFYLLNAADGTELLQSTSGNMCWGVALSANGTLMAGGSDDAHAYGFDPSGKADQQADPDA